MRPSVCKRFMLNSGAHPELRTELFFQSTKVDFSNPANHDLVQGLNYSIPYYLPVVGIEPATSSWLHLEAR